MLEFDSKTWWLGELKWLGADNSVGYAVGISCILSSSLQSVIPPVNEPSYHVKIFN